MTLVNSRAAFEKAVTDAVADVDPTITMVYDNVPFVAPGKTKKYIMMMINYTQSTLQNQGASSDFYSGVIQCNIYVPKSKGTSQLSEIAEGVITGLTSVNASTYTDTFSVSPIVGQIEGPTAITTDRDTHFLSVINCDFSANG